MSLRCSMRWREGSDDDATTSQKGAGYTKFRRGGLKVRASGSSCKRLFGNNQGTGRLAEKAIADTKARAVIVRSD
jgi:hypothetical protein